MTYVVWTFIAGVALGWLMREAFQIFAIDHGRWRM